MAPASTRIAHGPSWFLPVDRIARTRRGCGRGRATGSCRRFRMRRKSGCRETGSASSRARRRSPRRMPRTEAVRDGRMVSMRRPVTISPNCSSFGQSMVLVADGGVSRRGLGACLRTSGMPRTSPGLRKVLRMGVGSIMRMRSRIAACGHYKRLDGLEVAGGRESLPSNGRSYVWCGFAAVWFWGRDRKSPRCGHSH